MGSPLCSRKISSTRATPPKLRSAAYRASSRDIPFRTFSSTSIPRWELSSSSRSCSSRPFRNKAINRRTNTRSQLVIRHSSFIPKRHHRIEVRRPSGRDITREDCDRQHQNRHGAYGYRVRGRQSEQEAPQKMGAREGCRDPERHTGYHQNQSLPQHHGRHVGSSSSQRHADSDLTRAADDRIRHDSIEADARQHQRQEPKESQELGNESLLNQCSVDLLLESVHAATDDPVAALFPALTNLGSTRVRIVRRPRSEERRVGKECRSQWWPYSWRKRCGTI